MRPSGLSLSKLLQGLVFLIIYTILVVYVVQNSFVCVKSELPEPKTAKPTKQPTDCPEPIKCPECPPQRKCPPPTTCPKCPEPPTTTNLTKCPTCPTCPECATPTDCPSTDCAIDCPINCEVDCSEDALATKKPEEENDPFYDGPYEYQIDAAYERMLNLIKTHTIECPDTRFLGYHGQGGDAKRPEGTWPVCWPVPTKNCKLLTFGVADDPGFENQLNKATKCEIWAHDPTVSGAGLRLEPGVTFVKLGLGGADLDPPLSQYPVRKLSTLMERVGLERLPILKVDVEGAEWAFLTEAIQSGTIQKVGQLMIEVHFWPHLLPNAVSHHEMVRTWYRILKDLTNSGFKVFDYHENPFSTYPVDLFTRGRAACCHELGFINTRFNSTGFF